MFEKAKDMGHLTDSTIITTVLTYGAYIVGFLGAMMATIMGWFFKREIRKLDNLQKTAIRRPEFDNLRADLHDLKVEVKEGRQEFRNEHAQTRDLVNKALLKLK